MKNFPGGNAGAMRCANIQKKTSVSFEKSQTKLIFSKDNALLQVQRAFQSIYISHLVKIGINQSFLFSPNTSKKLLYFPKLNPFLSGPD